jgi:hypothetical protein
VPRKRRKQLEFIAIADKAQSPTTVGAPTKDGRHRGGSPYEGSAMTASKVFKPTDLPESNSSGYPAPFRDGQRKRWNRRLGDYGGLKNYGVNFVRVGPGGQSSARHAHTRQDEFV